jgi:hypothetical protein
MDFPKLLASMASIALFLQAQTDYRFAFPQSEILIGVDVKGFLKNPIFMDKLRGPDQKMNLPELGPISELLDQIDTVHMSVISKSAKQSDLLLLVQGRFDTEKLMQLGQQNGLRTEKWGQIQVLLPGKAKPVSLPRRKAAFQKAQFQMDLPQSKPGFAMLDKRRIVVGEEALLRVAIERLETGLTPQANPLFERARDLEAANDFWMVGSTAPLNQNVLSMQDSNPITKSVTQVRNFAIGMVMRQNLKVDMSLQAVSPKAAAEIFDLTKGALALVKMAPVPEGQLPIDFDKMIQISVKENLVRAQITMEQADVERMMAMATSTPPTTKSVEKRENNKEAKRQETVAASIPPPVAKPVAPTRRTVLIYGMPGGPKEIPVQ